MTTIASLMVRVGADLADFTRGMDQVANRLDRVGSSMQSTGSALTLGLTVPLAAVGITALKSAVSFESAFAGVRKTVDATEEEFEGLRKGILAMSREVPASANQIAAVAEAAGQLGIANENILSFTRTMIDLGEATNLSATEAATALARFANITQLPQDQIGNLGSAIVALGNNMATTESEIVSMGLRLAAAGSQIGLTEAQILAFAASLSSVGIEAEAGGTAISKAFIEVANAVRSQSEELSLFADVAGMTVAEFRQAFEQDAAGAMLAFIEGLGRVEEAGGNVFAVLEELGLNEVRLRNALLASASAGDLLRESLGLATTAFEENTALTDEAARRYETAESQLRMFKNRLTETAILLGGALAPALLSAIDAADPFIRLMEIAVETFVSLPAPMQTIVIALGALAAAAGPVLFVVGQMVTTISTLMTIAPLAAVALGSLAGPIGIGAIILSAGLAAVALWKMNDAINAAKDAANRAQGIQTILNTQSVAEIEASFARLEDRLTSMKERLSEVRQELISPIDSRQYSELHSEFVDLEKQINGTEEELAKYQGALDQVSKAQEMAARRADGFTSAAEEMAAMTSGAAAEADNLTNSTAGAAIAMQELNAQAIAASVALAIVQNNALGAGGGMALLFGGITMVNEALQQQAAIAELTGLMFQGADPGRKIQDAIAGFQGMVGPTREMGSAAGQAKTAVELMLEEFQRFADFAPRAMAEVTEEIDLYRQAALAAGDATAVGLIDNLLALNPTVSEVRQGIRLLQEQYGDLKAELEEPLDIALRQLQEIADRAPRTMQPLIVELMRYRAAAEEAGDATNRDLIDALLQLNPTASQVRSAISSLQASYGDLAQAARDAARAIEEANRLAAEGLEKLRQQAISELDFLGGAITTALKRQYDAQMDAELAALEAQRIVLESASKARMDAIQRQNEQRNAAEQVASERRLTIIRSEYERTVQMTRAQTEALLAPLRAQLELLEALDRAEEQDDFEDRLREIAQALKIAYDPRKEAELLQQREEVLEDMARAERRIQADSIRDQMRAIEDQAREQERFLSDQLRVREEAERNSQRVREQAERDSQSRRQDAERAHLQKQLADLAKQEEAIRAKYAALTTSWALESRAREMVMNGEMSAIVALLEEYYPEWRTAGLSFGQQLINGLRTSNIEGELRRIIDLMSLVTGGVPTNGASLQDVAADVASIARLVAGGAPQAAIEAQRRSFQQIYGFASPLAQGGLVRGPTLALMGEYPGANLDPEVAIRSSDLRQLIREEAGGGVGEIHITADLYIDGQFIDQRAEFVVRDVQQRQRRSAQLASGI